MDVRLNLINNTGAMDKCDVVMFGKNMAALFYELPVAWRAVKGFGSGESHPFIYPWDLQACASDSWPTGAPLTKAAPGQRFTVTQGPSGHVLQPTGHSSSVKEIEVVNGLPGAATNVALYRGDKLYAAKTSVAPGQMAAFEFKPTLWIGVATGVEEGQMLGSAITSYIDTELSLLGIASADIVMTREETGPRAGRFRFSLDNLVMA